MTIGFLCLLRIFVLFVFSLLCISVQGFAIYWWVQKDASQKNSTAVPLFLTFLSRVFLWVGLFNRIR